MKQNEPRLNLQAARKMMCTLAAPVLLGIILKEAALPPLQSFIDGPSTVFWVADYPISKIRIQQGNRK